MADLYTLLRPFIFLFSPEQAHGLSLTALKWGMGGLLAHRVNEPALRNTVFGLDFPSPVGLAAGYDKNGEVHDAILDLGFGFTEAGTITPKPQDGNPKPRLFRLTEDRAVINRLGFNNGGIPLAKKNLARHNPQKGILGVNVGANKTSEDRIADYVTGITELNEFADYFVVNISSPNTPGLRALQSKAALEDLLVRALAARDAVAAGKPTPLLLKVAPDLTAEDIRDIAAVAQETKIDGLIVSNTTIERPASLQSPQKGETGGLSGAPLFAPSTDILRAFYKATDGRIPLIGVGGIESGEQAYQKIRAGASLVQVYSALVYKGPGLAGVINQTLVKCLIKDGFSHIEEAIGADHR